VLRRHRQRQEEELHGVKRPPLSPGLVIAAGGIGAAPLDVTPEELAAAAAAAAAEAPLAPQPAGRWVAPPEEALPLLPEHAVAYAAAFEAAEAAAAAASAAELRAAQAAEAARDEVRAQHRRNAQLARYHDLPELTGNAAALAALNSRRRSHAGPVSWAEEVAAADAERRAHEAAVQARWAGLLAHRWGPTIRKADAKAERRAEFDAVGEPLLQAQGPLWDQRRFAVRRMRWARRRAANGGVRAPRYVYPSPTPVRKVQGASLGGPSPRDRLWTDQSERLREGYFEENFFRD
jgi:hypothetical protein